MAKTGGPRRLRALRDARKIIIFVALQAETYNIMGDPQKS
ncbi:hypothetical protein D1AOALGA4SA_2718 [Olavius algarvensis Delta 1 endosymbiont]|nr:hypothetical protein D1AOALGA4SA_2718 [Olavius algarvensis Delta 1 endosymbiont]